MKKLALFFFISFVGFSQNYTRKDSLQGGLRQERTCYDVLRYNLDLQILPTNKSIEGHNEIIFKIDDDTKKIQVDLFENMLIDSIIHQNKKLKYKREFNAIFIDFKSVLKKGSKHNIKIYYHGNPIIAENAPWDGGFVFKKDSNNKPWVGVAVQGTGASLWYPCKDSQTDEPNNGANIKVTVPNGLMNVSNGRFKGSKPVGTTRTQWEWEVINPINNYDITINIADYAHIHDNLNGLDLDFYVLKENEEKAKSHFENDVKPMLNCFQAKFGKYPFFEDGYKLVETPYLGMEHQSAVAYGNKYKKGYLGSDLSGTGVGMFFDYITIHETGHEWFGNSITSQDIADMWIHEGFTTYSETVFIECMKGYEQAMIYINGQSKNVQNDKPIIGKFGVNKEGSGDMYFKGSLLLNTIRHIVNDDNKWWTLLLKYSETYKKQIINTKTVIDFFNTEIGIDLTSVFYQYLNRTNIPKLVLEKNDEILVYYFTNVETNFTMPIDIFIDNTEVRIIPTNKPQNLSIAKKWSLSEITPAQQQFFINYEKK